jgi:hypothetical protein
MPLHALEHIHSCEELRRVIAVGNIGAANLWIFVGVAGMFIYISLVDMVRL